MSKLCRCGAVVSSRCYKCNPSVTNRSFYASNRWRKLSEAKRAHDVLCEQCLDKGKTTAADEVHHIQSVIEAPHLKWEWSNLMSVCIACHRELDAGGGSNVRERHLHDSVGRV